MRNKITRKAAALFMALLLCFGGCLTGSASAASVSSFTDLSSGGWYYDSVSYVVSKGLYNGLSTTSFGPNNTMNRAMFVTVLGRMAGVSPDSWCAATISGSGVNFRSGPGTSYGTIGSFTYGASVTITGRSGDWYAIRSGSKNGYVKSDYVSPKYKNFSDVSYGQYYTGYVIWAYEKGYVSGTSSTTFSPTSSITREQICKILDGYASGNNYSIAATKSSVSFSDSASIHSWASDAVKTMQLGGIVNGYTDGSFKPTNSATRAEVACILHKFLQSTGASVPSGGSDSSSGGSDSGSGGSSDSGTQPDAADISSDRVSISSKRMRVGLYPSTQSFDNQVSSVTLTNLSGSGFEYGIMTSDRSFESASTLNASTISIQTNGSYYTVSDSSGNTLVMQEGEELAIHPLGDHPLTRVNGGYDYHGDFNCLNSFKDKTKITLVNYVDIEDYVKGSLPYEFPSYWSTETLKAAAIAVRSYAMAYTETSVYSRYGFDLVSGSSCQLYLGRKNAGDSAYSTTDAAVDATANMYLTYNGSVCYCMYSSKNGGTTEAGYYDYLASKTDPYDGEISGGYAGHGIGMSQYGAYAMAKNHGYNYLDILGFYYTGTTVKYGA